MGCGLHSERRGWLHTVRHGGGWRRANRRRTPRLGVAMTRAKFHLRLIQPLRFFRSQQHRYGDSYVFAPRSRFIPDGILDLFECGAWPEEPVDGSKPARGSLCADVAARIRGMWG